MEILYHRDFIKNYRRRIHPNKKLDLQFKKRLALLINEPTNPLLKDHRLIGRKKMYKSFSVTADIRVVYRREKDKLLLYDIGTHAQVY